MDFYQLKTFVVVAREGSIAKAGALLPFGGQRAPGVTHLHALLDGLAQGLGGENAGYAAIGAALESGEALAFLSEPEIHPGVDRVVAVFPDGRAFAWHQLNDSPED